MVTFVWPYAFSSVPLREMAGQLVTLTLCITLCTPLVPPHEIAVKLADPNDSVGGPVTMLPKKTLTVGCAAELLDDSTNSAAPPVMLTVARLVTVELVVHRMLLTPRPLNAVAVQVPAEMVRVAIPDCVPPRFKLAALFDVVARAVNVALVKDNALAVPVSVQPLGMITLFADPRASAVREDDVTDSPVTPVTTPFR